MFLCLCALCVHSCCVWALFVSVSYAWALAQHEPTQLLMQRAMGSHSEGARALVTPLHGSCDSEFLSSDKVGNSTPPRQQGVLFENGTPPRPQHILLENGIPPRPQSVLFKNQGGDRTPPIYIYINTYIYIYTHIQIELRVRVAWPPLISGPGGRGARGAR